MIMITFLAFNGFDVRLNRKITALGDRHATHKTTLHLLI